ncbi:acyl carrier protein [Neosynechococcus sphagnicola sy1]|uniref:Acyl carrier protein n=2 Tax=Neosynechococcus TaxID=1501143 RepID=A0A098TP36_9CYAN|nr:acyl carrier protein [Neosynechococcus sphagnicola sy1]
MILDRADIQLKVINVLKDMTIDWELDLQGGINMKTRLMEDLAFESLDIVQLVVSLEKTFEQNGLPFARLFMRDDEYVDEILVGELVDFLAENIVRHE